MIGRDPPRFSTSAPLLQLQKPRVEFDAIDVERRRKLKATLGSGGKTLRVRTGDGSIRIEG